MHPASVQFKQSKQAFTLAEVMMATVVTLVALVGLIAAITMGSEMLDVSRKQTVAMQMIRNEIDGVHLLSWTAVNALPTNASITINSSGTGLVSCTPAGNGQTAFALTNYTTSYVPPYLGGVNDDNASLMSVAKDFNLSLVVTTITGRPNFLVLTYTVTWTGGNQRKVYTRSGTTYYGKNGLNLYYQR